ncbi:MAG: DUF368 domain-containing protein [Bradymonadia bacterium]
MKVTDDQNQPQQIGALALFLRGIAMGAADVVPGVSGGTIAFITGIYQQFIDALKSLSAKPILRLFTGQVGQAVVELKTFHWRTLIPLGLGVAIAIVSLSKVVTTCMEDYPAPTYALFFGLILFSAVAPYLQINRKSVSVVGIFLVSAFMAWLFVGLHPDSPNKKVIRADSDAKTLIYIGKIRSTADVSRLTALRDSSHPTLELRLYDPKRIMTSSNLPPNTVKMGSKDELKAWYTKHEIDGAFSKPLVVVGDHTPNLFWIFISGFIAISAMVLPGLSGSFLLLFLGLYHIIFGALHGVIGAGLTLIGKSSGPLQQLAGTSGLDDLFIVIAFGFGVLCGLAIFSRIVAWLFERAKDITLAALTGLMVGALRLPFNKISASTEQFSEGVGPVVLSALAGALIVLALLRIDLKRAANASTDMPE